MKRSMNAIALLGIALSLSCTKYVVREVPVGNEDAVEAIEILRGYLDACDAKIDDLEKRLDECEKHGPSYGYGAAGFDHRGTGIPIPERDDPWFEIIKSDTTFEFKPVEF